MKEKEFGGTMNLSEQIIRLKKEKNALVLAHYYQIPEIQDVADFVGDSLALAQVGEKAEESMIIVCGVKFMAESAKILSPYKKILAPRIDAGCPMADMANTEDLRKYKEEHPNRYVVSYVNTTADVKTLTDICVTSSNALKIMSQIDAKEILFLPDKNLGGYIKKQMPEKDIDLWPGFCLTHHRLKGEQVLAMKKEYPEALFLVHPECNEDVLQYGDFIGSTKGILEYATQSKHKQFIIGTEDGIMHPLQLNNPDKEFILASGGLTCQNMKKTSLEDLLYCLEKEETEILLDEETIQKAKAPLDKMLALS